MKIIQDDSLLSSKDKKYIKDHILAFSLPWYYSSEAVKGDNYWFYCHNLVQRIELGGGETSNHTKFFVGLFKKFCKKHKIKYSQIFRCCLNSNFPSKNKSLPHTDHNFDYNHLLIYLTNVEDGETVLLKDDKKTVIKIIKPKAFRAVSFPKCWHIGTSPKKDRRVVAVYTYK